MPRLTANNSAKATSALIGHEERIARRLVSAPAARTSSPPLASDRFCATIRCAVAQEPEGREIPGATEEPEAVFGKSRSTTRTTRLGRGRA
jgi:hypothetical protein